MTESAMQSSIRLLRELDLIMRVRFNRFSLPSPLTLQSLLTRLASLFPTFGNDCLHALLSNLPLELILVRTKTYQFMSEKNINSVKTRPQLF